MQRPATRFASSNRFWQGSGYAEADQMHREDDEAAEEAEADSDPSAASSSRRSRASRPRGRLLFTQPIALTSEQMNNPALLDALMRRSRDEGEGQMLLLRPPPSHQFPPASTVRPSPHSHLFLQPNIYAPCTRPSESARIGALMRQSGDADDAVDCQYAQWQHSRRRQERSTFAMAQQRAEEREAEADLKMPMKRSFAAAAAAAASSLKARSGDPSSSAAAAAASSGSVGSTPLAATSSVEDLASELYVSASPTLDQPLPPLLKALPRALRRLDDPLAIRAFIEKQNARAVDSVKKVPGSVRTIADDSDDSDEPYTPTLFDPTSGVALSSSTLQLEASLGSNSDSDSEVELPPQPDPDPNADGLIRYAKNVGYVSLVAAAGTAPAGTDPFAPADPLAHLHRTPIHPLAADNLLGVMSRELAECREQRLERRRLKASASRNNTASAPSASSDNSSDSSDSEPDDDFALESSVSAGGILAPTLYCGSRGSMTSIHAENDQFASFHQISAGVKVWYSVAATRANREKVMRLMRQLNWISSVVSTGDLDAELKSHAFFFDPYTLCRLGMDVHCTIQTPSDSLVLTSGALHQVLNLTAVEGWSVNWLSPAMMSTVAEVRQERSEGWRWSYPEGVSLAALCWKAAVMIPAQQEFASSSASAPVGVSPPLQLECARTLLPLLQDELAHRAQLDELRIAGSGLTSSTVRIGSRKRVVAAVDLTDDAVDEPTLPFQLPLAIQSPPRSYPELCMHCENLSFFSAVFSKPVEDGADSVHLCCTACLLRYLRMRADVQIRKEDTRRTIIDLEADVELESVGSVYEGAASSRGSSSDSSRSSGSRSRSRSPKRSRAESSPALRSSSLVSAAAAAAAGAAPSTPTNWSSAGMLPTAEERASLFRSKFDADLLQRRRLWRRAILCERVTVQMAEEAKQRLLGQIGETQGKDAQENEELQESEREREY